MDADLTITVAVMLCGVLLAATARKTLSIAIAAWIGLSALFGKYVLFSGASLINLNADRVLLSGVAIGICLNWVRGGIRFSRLQQREWLMFAFVGWGVLSLWICGTLFSAYGVKQLGILTNGFVVPFGMFYLGRHALVRRGAKDIAPIMSLLLLYVIGTAFAEHFQINWMVFPSYILDPSVGIHADRARGPFLNAAVDGAVIAMLLVFVVHASQYAKSWTPRIAAVPLLISGFVASYFTETRGPWIALGCGSVIMLFHRRARTSFGIVLALTAALGIVSLWLGVNPVPQRSDTSDFRLNLYRESLIVFEKHPLIGWGWGTFTDDTRRFNGFGPTATLGDSVQHDTVVAIATDTGAIGAILYLSILFSTFSSLFLKCRSNAIGEQQRDFALTCLAIGVIYVVNGSFADTRYFMFANSLFFFLAGVANAAWSPIHSVSARQTHPSRLPNTSQLPILDET